MVLSNAERQARFQQRLRQRASSGVTPEMVIKATRLAFESWVAEAGAYEREVPTWANMLAGARKRGYASRWQQWVPCDVADEYSEFGADAPMMRAVAKVVAAVLGPPDAD